MAGTKHFTRMNYHVSRGLREIIAPIQTIPDKEWSNLKERFNSCCAYCGELASAENRGIVADHIIPVTDYGELVLGNIIPVCQSCNDSRGNKSWREFISNNFPDKSKERIRIIEAYLSENPYKAPTPETVLSVEQLAIYNELFTEWNSINVKANILYEARNGKKALG